MKAKRWLSVLLLVCMLAGLLPANVLAAVRTEEKTASATDKAPTKTAVSYVSQIESLATPYNVAYNDPSWNFSNIVSDETDAETQVDKYYYVVNKASDTEGYMLAMNEKYTEKYYHATDVAISGDSLTDPNPDSAVKFLIGSGASRGSIHPIKGVFTSVAGLKEETYVSIFRSVPGVWGCRMNDGKKIFISFQGNISYAEDAWFSLQYVPTRDSTDEFYGEDGFATLFHEGHEEAYSDAEMMQLYRVYTQGFELYKAIKAMAAYADGNADKRYPEALYAEFSNYLDTCISTYNTNNKAVTTAEETTLKAQMDAMAETLLGYRDDLTKNDGSLSFIDIPVEVLDFRADGMVFEWSGSNTGYYSLWSAPGTTEAAELTPWQNVRRGLTEEYLVGGQIVYKESTVKTVAQGLEKKIGYDWGTNGSIKGWNGAFYEKMNTLTKLGTFDETIAKTDSKANGGYLHWQQVETCYDMAYYMLSNFWRAVKSDDYIDTTNKLGYNMVVPERKRLRLYMDEETGLYTMDASNVMCYDGYYSFNAVPESPTTRLVQDAYFTPADHLGFESDTYKTLLGDTDHGSELAKYQHELADTNYHFSLHAKGSFVYYRSQNLYFEFIGDDDVYFFINGRRVMDLGADHPPAGDALWLNEIADEHGWVDGGVYSFDMFYIERHTARSNLKFSTNIHIVETETMTTKGMYLENDLGTDKVSSATGMGEELNENALLHDGDIVAYSFNVANSRDVPVYKLSFHDATLGASLSPGAVTLCNTALTGGVNTAIGDIEVYYRTIAKDGTIYSGNPEKKTFAEITSMINSANSAKSSLATGAYRVTVDTVDNLKSLLTLGLPKKCQILVYGFKRQAQGSLPSYENVLTSVCYYNLSGTAQSTPGTEEIPINGSASRTYKVVSVPPTVDRQELVLDYGKKIEIPVDTIRESISTDALTTINGLAGITVSGSHEQLLTSISASNLLCASNGKTYVGKQGTFTRTKNGLTYQPTRFMDTVETVYLVYNITETNGANKYMLVELKLLPATSVYYEDNFSDGTFAAATTPQDYLFFDFSNTEEDQKRYRSHAYGMYNFDREENAHWATHATDADENTTDKTINFRNFSIDNATGTATILVGDTMEGEAFYYGPKFKTTTTYGIYPWTGRQDYAPLNYDPAGAEYLQLRFKLTDCDFVASSSGQTKPRIGLEYHYYDANGNYVGISYNDFWEYDCENFDDGGYMTVKFKLTSRFKTASKITSIGVRFANIKSSDINTTGRVTIDYIYVGPEADLPAQDSLLFDFTGTDADSRRYAGDAYGGFNFDNNYWAYHTSRVSSLNFDKNGVGTMTFTSSNTSTYVQTSTLQDQKLLTLPLSYDPSAAQIAQIRLKLTGFSSAKMYVEFFQNKTALESLPDACSYTFNSAQLSHGRFVTVKMALSDVFKASDVINALRLTFNTNTTGTICVDYIYIGPEADAPIDDHFYVDFRNSEDDRVRYEDPVYGGRNYDTANWETVYYNGSKNLTVSHEIDNVTGSITCAVTDTGAHLSTVKFTAQNLSLNTTGADVLKIRFAVENMKAYSSNTFIRLWYPGSYNSNTYSFGTAYVSDGSYITVTTKLDDAVRAAGELTSLTFSFHNLIVNDTKGVGKITVDYFYVGREADFDKVRAENAGTWQVVTDDAAQADGYQDQDQIGLSADQNISALESIGAGPARCNEYYGAQNGMGKISNNIPVSFSHKAAYHRTSENSYLAIYDSIMLGVDGIEIDLMLTKDNVVILNHNTDLSGMTGKGSTAISALNWDTVKDYPLKVNNGTGGNQYYRLTADDAAVLNSIENYEAHYGEAATANGYHYPARLDDVLELIRERGPDTIITLDKITSKEILLAAYQVLSENQMLDQAYFALAQTAATMTKWIEYVAEQCGISVDEVKSSLNMLYLVGANPKISDLQAHIDNGGYLKAVECTYNASAALSCEKHLVNEYLPFCEKNHIPFWASAIGANWSGGRDDDETTWLHFLRMGASGIKTNHSTQMAAFMHYYNGASRSASEILQAEHFQNYNYESARFYMSAASDHNNNKLVNEMHNNDCLEYRNITFTGSETTLYATAKGMNGGGTLKFYADEVRAENCFAEVAFGNSEYCVTRAVNLRKSVSKGSHTVYVQASGDNAFALVSFDSFTFEKPTDDHYLFFDFTNTAEDQNRYKKAIYGSKYNFDTKDYWASEKTPGASGYSQFSIDNNAGVAILNVGTSGSDGPMLMTTTTYGVYPAGGKGAYAPLNYVPSSADYLVVRFRLDGVTDSGDNVIRVDFWNNTDGNHQRTWSNDLRGKFACVTGQYQTVALPMPKQFTQADSITSLGVWFNGICSSSTTLGTITIDYIYVGPLQHTDRMLIDFEGSLGTYDDAVYGSEPLDLQENWRQNSSARSTAPTVANGAVSITTTGQSDANYYHIRMVNAPLTYVPGDDDYCQVRFKIDNGALYSTSSASLHVYYSPDLYGTDGIGSSNNSSAAFDFAAINNKGYYILNVPMTSATYCDAGVIRSLGLMFNGLSKTTVMTITVDYIYLGPIDKAPNAVGAECLFFDFENDAAAQDRYNAPAYGYVNYDDPEHSHWNKDAQGSGNNGAATSAVIDNAEGTLTLTAKPDRTYVWTETCASGTALDNPLELDTAYAEYCQVRFKLENFVTNNTATPSVALYPGFDHSSDIFYDDYVGHKRFDAAYLSNGQYITVTFELPTQKFAEHTSLTNARFQINDAVSASGATGKVTIDYIYIGLEKNLPTNYLLTYGYDSSYGNDSKLSDGSALVVEGQGVTKLYSDKTVNYAGTEEYTELSFVFTGTGFDLISRTGANQGLLRAMIYDAKGKFVKMAQVINRSENNLELYQVPVLSIEGLTHGTYTAKIFVGEAYDYGNDGCADDFGGALDRGGEFTFDALRIYNPINTAATDTVSQTAYDIYQRHAEADPTYTEVRNMLITAKNFNAGGTMSGAVYLDAKGDSQKTALANYTEVGPNNEVYLAAGKAIAFKLSVTGILPASIDIGVKSANGEPVHMVAQVSKTAPAALPEIATCTNHARIEGSTQQYRQLTILPSHWTTGTTQSEIYVTICNGGDGILSITDIKCAYDTANPSSQTANEKSPKFLVTPEMLAAMNVCTEHNYCYEAQGDMHEVTCRTCSYSVTEAHEYTNGTCICGAAESAVPIPNDNMKFDMVITVGAEMNVGYSFMAEPLAGYESFYLEVRKNVAGGEPIVTVYDLEDLKTFNDPTTGEAVIYSATFAGIAAKEMGDEFAATLYAVNANGKVFCGPTQTTSIKTALLEKFGGKDASDELKTMAIDMLCYGAATQILFDYDADNLVTADLTEEMLTYATKGTAEAVDHYAVSGNGANINTAVTVGSRVELGLNALISTASDVNAVRCVITDEAGKILEEPTVSATENVMFFSASYRNVGAREMRKLINATFYEGDKAVSKTITWSIESYVAQTLADPNTSQEKANMVNAMLTYGDSVGAYLTSIGQ